ncbi:hypothetical protein GW935_01905 [Candidatus Falkowbacteria bacterium]|nr:hypothetical protein [Candidatus Falkowbacteria bacterium]
MITVTWDGTLGNNSVIIYINGSIAIMASYGTSITAPRTNTATLKIGSYPKFNSR